MFRETAEHGLFPFLDPESGLLDMSLAGADFAGDDTLVTSVISACAPTAWRKRTRWRPVKTVAAGGPTPTPRRPRTNSAAAGGCSPEKSSCSPRSSGRVTMPSRRSNGCRKTAWSRRLGERLRSPDGLARPAYHAPLNGVDRRYRFEWNAATKLGAWPANRSRPLRFDMPVPRPSFQADRATGLRDGEPPARDPAPLAAAWPACWYACFPAVWMPFTSSSSGCLSRPGPTSVTRTSCLVTGRGGASCRRRRRRRPGRC